MSVEKSSECMDCGSDVVGVSGDVGVEVPMPKKKGKGGSRKVILPDGTVSYGFKADGTPKKAPGRKPKSSKS